MTMSPKPSIAKFFAASPFSSTSWGKITETEEADETSELSYLAAHIECQ